MNYIPMLFLLFMTTSVLGQEQEWGKYWVEFSDKEGSHFNVQNPHEFLSQRSIERRIRQGIPIVENDLPVKTEYLKKIRSTGAKIHHVSKWLNAATLTATDVQMQAIKEFKFVTNSAYVGKHLLKKFFLKQENKQRDSFSDYKKKSDHYGYGAHQIKMLNGDYLHKMGYQGEGILVAILDGGFTNVDIMPFFDSLRAEGKIYPGYDFVEADDYVYESSSHGSKVMSVMGSNLPGLFVGSAPKASYTCIKTEDTKAEYLVEVCNWVAGVEYADSIGADIINSSLGYTGFTDTSMNYDYQDLDGEFSQASRAADIAFSKGMIVVNSAGNSGSNNWKYIGVPADAKKIMSVGAVKSDRNKASFSSFGPTADGRIKPNVSAMGQRITVASLYSYFTESSNGTSFASPLMAGMIASLWQAFPDKTNEEIFNAVEQSGDQASNPDNELGYGIPNFKKAFNILKNGDHYSEEISFNRLDVFPNPFNHSFEIIIPIKESGLADLKLVDILGQTVYAKQLNLNNDEYQTIQLDNFNFLTKGSYFVILRMKGRQYFASILKI